MNKKEYILLTIIFILALSLRIIGIDFGLPDPTLSDEFQIIERALQMGTGDLNPHLFTWPGHLPTYLLFSLYTLQFVIGFLLKVYRSSLHYADLYFRDPTVFFESARLISALVGSGAVVLFYFLLRGLFNLRTAIIGTLLLALSYPHLRHSHFARPDVYATFFVLLSILIFFMAVVNKKSSLIYLSGFACGMGIATKFNSAILVIPLLISTPLIARRMKNRLKDSLYLVIGVISGTFLFAPYLLLDFQGAYKDITAQIVRLNSSRFGAISNQFPYLVKVLLLKKLGYVITLSLIPGIIILLFKKGKMKVPILSFAALYILVVGTKRVPPHYILPLIPILILISAYLIDRILSLLDDKLKNIYIYALNIIVISALLVYPSISAVKLLSNFTRKDTRTVAREFIEREILEGSRILVETIQPDVDSPQLYPTKSSIKRIIKNSKSKGRFKYFINDEDYPYSNRTYKLFTITSVEGDIKQFILKNDIEYIIVSKFQDEDYYLDQILDPGDETYDTQFEFYEILSDDDKFKPILNINPLEFDYRGPHILIYEVVE